MAAAKTKGAAKSVFDADFIISGTGYVLSQARLRRGDIGGLGRGAVTRRAKELPRNDHRFMAFLALAG